MAEFENNKTLAIKVNVYCFGEGHELFIDIDKNQKYTYDEIEKQAEELILNEIDISINYKDLEPYLEDKDTEVKMNNKQSANDSLTANDYQRMAMRTVNANTYDDDYKMLRNAVYGLNGEAGEIIDLLKKHEFQGHALDEDKLIDEAGDVAWYLAQLATALGVSLQDIMLQNVEKLKARYPDGFNKNRSVNRKNNEGTDG